MQDLSQSCTSHGDKFEDLGDGASVLYHPFNRCRMKGCHFCFSGNPVSDQTRFFGVKVIRNTAREEGLSFSVVADEAFFAGFKAMERI